MRPGPAFTLDQSRAGQLAENYTLEGDASERDHIAFLLVEEAITDGILHGDDPYSLAADRVADSDGDLDGYTILLYLADGYWIRSPIKRASSFTGPAGILRDAADAANAMAKLAQALHRPRQTRQRIRRILRLSPPAGTATTAMPGGLGKRNRVTL